VRVVHWYPNLLAGGGVANSVDALATAQSRLGAEVWIACLWRNAPVCGPVTPGDRVAITTWTGGHSLGRGRMTLHTMDRAAVRSLEALQPDVVHAHGEFNPDNWWPPRLWRRPLVLTPHGAYHPTVLNRAVRRKKVYLAVADRLLYRHVSRFHALSPAEQRDISAALPRVRTFYVPQGPSPAVQREVDRHSAAANRAGPINFMFVGRIDIRTKGLDVLVEAFAAAVAHQAKPARLTLVGPDWRGGVAPLRALAARRGVLHLVEIRDRVADAEVPRVFDECDVYVQLSRNEGSPLSVNDALVLGKPIIVSNRVGTVSCPEIARLPHVRIVAPKVPEATEAIAATLDDFSCLRQRAGFAAHNVRNLLSWSRAAQLHLNEYDSLLVEDRSL
jgi:glycosyltransferase involved in cell wall biosynthesis